MKTKAILTFLVFAQLMSAQRIMDVKELVQKLTTEEKVSLVVGVGMDLSWMGEPPTVGLPEEKIEGAAGTSRVIERLDIPGIVFSDGPAGVRINPHRKNDPTRTFYATAFPVATLLSSTFNVETLESVGVAFGDECKDYGVDVLLAPALNIHRNPLGGRNFEYYSEDPIVSGKMAAAFTKGVQSEGVGVSIKHFAANNAEFNRTNLNTFVSTRAMREIYLKGFEIAVKESDPWTIMSSYNLVNDVYTSENPELLTTILRDEWGYKGFVMTDWWAGKSAVAQMKAGNDLLMPGTEKQQQAILTALADGSLKMEDLDRNVGRILNIYVKTYSYNNYKPTGTPQLEKHKEVARNAASEGMVLLKNEKSALPITKASNVALFGVGSYMTIAGGTGSGDVNKAYMISIREGLKYSGITLNSTVESAFEVYLAEQKKLVKPKANFFMPDIPFEEMAWTDEQLVSVAKSSSIAVFTIQRTSGEGADRPDSDFDLKENEKQFIAQLSKAFHAQNKPVVVLLNLGGVIETVSWKENPDAILLVWQPGQEGGNAVADILTGKVNPSGKLPMTFPANYTDAYSSKNFPGKQLDPEAKPSIFFGAPSEITYEEDIYVGYRYFDTYNVAVSYPFGYGLSYTTFTLSDMTFELLPNGDFKVSCSVKNSGKVSGKEVVQLYSSAPKGKLSKPAKELKAFVKTKLLAAGESQIVEFVVSKYQLSSYDSETFAWILEKGDYTISLGTSSANLSLNTTYKQVKSEDILKTNKVLVPTRTISGLK